MTPRVLGALLAALVLGGCRGTVEQLPDLPLPPRVVPKYLAVKTPGVEISDPAGSWIVTTGTQISSPFKSEDIPYVSLKKIEPKSGPVQHKSWTGKNPPPDNAVTDWDSKEEARRGARNSIFVRVFFEYVPRAPEPPIYIKALRGRAQAMEWLAKGGQRVLVRAPDSDKPLHGVLVLSSSVSTTTKVGRVYRIEVPKEDVNRVLEREGRVATIMKPYSARVEVKGTRFGKPGPGKSIMTEQDFYTKPKVRGLTWILWISTRPFE